MRFSIASVALLAGAVVAVPQYTVQPISQISDGQIQAPPATSAAVPGASEVASSAVVVVPTASGSDVVVVPTASGSDVDGKLHHTPLSRYVRY
jgi:hypothetical protein